MDSLIFIFYASGGRGAGAGHADHVLKTPLYVGTPHSANRLFRARLYRKIMCEFLPLVFLHFPFKITPN